MADAASGKGVPEFCIVPTVLLQKVLVYLARHPFADVAQMITELQAQTKPYTASEQLSGD